MNYCHVEVESHKRGEWFAFIRETCIVLEAPSRAELEGAVRDHLEQSLGLKRYQIIWC